MSVTIGEAAALAEADVSTLPVAGLMRLVEETSAAINQLAGVRSRALGELAARGNGQVPDPVAAGATVPLPAWLRGAAHVSGHTAGQQIRTATALRELPAVTEAVVDGLITVEHGRVLARLVGAVDPQALLESQPQLVEVARRTDPDQLASYVRHLLATWCEPALEEDEAAAEDRRFVQVRNTHRGSWRGSFELADAAMEIVLPVLESLARRDGNDDRRSAGQRRADAMTDVFALALRHGDLPDAGGSRPRLTYVAPEQPAPAQAGRGSDAAHGSSALPDRFTIDLDRHPGAGCPTGVWTGPATRAQIERLLCDARVERLVLGVNGQIVDLTSSTEQITAAQRRAVAARDRCCTAKGCSRPPAFCDVHHLRARSEGGSTDVDNLVLLCRRHHVMWHRQQIGIADLRVPWKRMPQPRAPART